MLTVFVRRMCYNPAYVCPTCSIAYHVTIDYYGSSPLRVIRKHVGQTANGDTSEVFCCVGGSMSEQTHEIMPTDEHLRWIYLTNYHTKRPVGMRTWFGDYRCDIKFADGKFEYWISECWNSGDDVYWTRSRYSNDVFAAMADGEKWIREMQYALVYGERDGEAES